MKITDMRTNNHSYFRDLKEGEVFLWDLQRVIKLDCELIIKGNKEVEIDL